MDMTTFLENYKSRINKSRNYIFGIEKPGSYIIATDIRSKNKNVLNQ